MAVTVNGSVLVEITIDSVIVTVPGSVVVPTLSRMSPASTFAISVPAPRLSSSSAPKALPKNIIRAWNAVVLFRPSDDSSNVFSDAAVLSATLLVVGDGSTRTSVVSDPGTVDDPVFSMSDTFWPMGNMKMAVRVVVDEMLRYGL